MTNDWIDNVRAYCLKYNIPIEYLAEIVNDPKVVPMIRGKAFEYSAMLYLKTVLPANDWVVDKPIMNAQFGLHDMDIRVQHKATGKTIGVECKLAAKGSFQVLKNGSTQLKVKCMRSRTLGDAKAQELATKIGLPVEMLKIHNDQYIPSDFQVVLTSIANAFYTTNTETDMFDWSPSGKGIDFLKYISNLSEVTDLQYFTYNQLYLATAESLAVKEFSGHKCSRKTCPSPNNCGFIPNYPIINFPIEGKLPLAPWHSAANAVDFFTNFI